ncbi:hypothetical protein HYPSUDRAFT_211221 [Hypholoma sublateritium FD-334 SS-4]|uniref:Autophagy-related protein 14 n=1 Tax=Hypholoma sublateritium (strain FD-334 SS-4) TaxID=945553 RepID=A0A0D2PEZ4_HYPSF|nr:hypothetical protein HYPSUDRAFT_211221 [Hypholoma sublateritium FD-334 SS-4]
MSSTTTSVDHTTYGSDHITARRTRHITEIQIRNLTPFPVRDAVTTALTQPTEHSQFSAPGVVDDLGAIVSRKHTRKASTASSSTRFNLKWEEGILEQSDRKPSSESRERRTSTSSTVNLNASTSSSKSIPPSSSSRSVRSLRGHRPRTSSMTSSSSIHLASSMFSTGESSTAIPPAPSDNSQASLEKIINSRMVETFITISLPLANSANHGVEASSPDSPNPPVPLRSAPMQKPSSLSRVHKTVGSSSSAKHLTSLFPSHKARVPMPSSAPPSKTTFDHHATPKQDAKSKSHLSSKPNGLSFPTGSLTRGEKPVTEQSTELQDVLSNGLETPVYFSPVHRPSINPLFYLDVQSGRDFCRPCDTSGQFLKVEVWGKVPLRERYHDTSEHHKGSTATESHVHWKLLEEKDIHLNKLLPLPDDLETNPSQLPSNTILVTLSPPGRTFYLPRRSPSLDSRSSSPTGGYTSDPESEIRKAKQNNDQPSSDVEIISPAEILPLSRRRRHQGPQDSIDLGGRIKTANWQDLFKLVNLQSLISDNEASLGEVVRKINGLLKDDETFPMRREISERELRIKEMTAKHNLVVDQIAQRKLEIADRAEKLKKRLETLTSARDVLTLDPEVADRIEDERNRLEPLHTKMLSTRTSLLSLLTTIFPIELYSPPDLLYTILDVPLPIPLNPTDPAPPLTMSEHKDVTEDAVATALGYVAQVLQILAAYIGKNLVYPVTCIGSRSLIRDGISAMVGPRMFPLFSKGVDTYRFEYGVFLLNKDIEMLMSERDLRALDMRHTLPNLKNLLLTLSHDIDIYHHSVRLASIPVSPTGLQTPLRTPSPENDNVQTPKPSHINLDARSLAEGATTPTVSGTTTPTASLLAEESRKQKSFLGFVPFTDFLRSRYPSSSTKTSSETDDDEESEDEHSDEISEGSEEDRMTIHAAASDGVPATVTRDIVAEI